jgi:hypothetical protein
MMAASEKSALLPNRGDDFASFNDDLQFCLDLGLVKTDDGLRPANPIYANLMVRYYNENIQMEFPEELAGKWMDGQILDMTGLLKAFQQFWTLNSEKYLAGMDVKELGPHLLLSAFLQLVVGGGGQVINHFANGWGYADIFILYAGRRYVIELKIKENQRSHAKSIEQLQGYMNNLFDKEAWLVVFDSESTKTWPEKITWETETLTTGHVIHIVGC